MTFKATLTDVGIIERQSVRDLRTDYRRDIPGQEDGIYLAATDPTMVTLVRFRLLSLVFQEYHVESSEDLSINIDNLITS